MSPAKLRPKASWVFLIAVVTARPGSSATLAGPSQTVNAGDTVSVALSLASGGQAVSAVQFDLVWDPALNIHLAPGAQAGTSDKTLMTSLLQPNQLRCLFLGLNQSVLADGELLRLFVTVSAGAPVGTSQVQMRSGGATGPDGTPILLQDGALAFQVQSGPIQGIQSSGVLNAASLAAAPVSPGEIVTLFGSIAASAPTILFNNVPATVTYAGLNQVNAVVPFGLNIGAPAQVEIRQGGISHTTTVPVASAAPAMFTLSASGTGPGAILNQDYSVNSPATPAAPGSVIMIFGTGFGALNPLPVDGQIARTLATTPSAVTATIDGTPAAVKYAGAAPTLINGVVQINVQIPPAAHTNPAAPLSLVMGSFATPPGVTVAIQ